MIGFEYIANRAMNTAFVLRNYPCLKKLFSDDKFSFDLQISRGRILINKEDKPYCDYGRDNGTLYLTQYSGNGNQDTLPPGYIHQIINKGRRRIMKKYNRDLEWRLYEPEMSEQERK